MTILKFVPKKPTCSDSAISKRTGKPIYGIAAMLQNMSDQGGPDQYRKNIAKRASEITFNELVKDIYSETKVAWFFHRED